MNNHGRGVHVIQAASSVGGSTDNDSVTVTLFIGIVSAVLFLYVLYLRTLKRLREARELQGENEKERKDTRTSVSIFINDLIFSNGSLEIIHDSVAPLSELASKCNLYLFVQVEDENNIANILNGLEQCEAFKGSLKKHGVLFSSTSNGRASMVRQLQPTLHMESNVDVVKAIHSKIANLLLFKVVGGDVTDAGDKVKAEENDVVNVKTVADIIKIVQPLITVS